MRGAALPHRQNIVSGAGDISWPIAAHDGEWAIERRRIEDGRYWVSPAGARRKWRSTVFHWALVAFTSAIRVAALYEHGRRGALTPKLTNLTLSFPTLPKSFDGYRILHLTDTHLDILPELANVARVMLAGLEVDTLALTGDVLGCRDAPLASAVEPLAHVIEAVSVRDRRFAVLGNHDPPAMAEALAALGFEVLLNRSVELERGGERVIVTGLDDVHSFYTEAARDALRGPGPTGFRVALVHSPEIADHASAAGVKFYLCGHTHGGQVCWPSGKPLITQLTRCCQAARGLWDYGPMKGYTSAGLGSSWPPLRYHCPGEMTLITLRVGDQNSCDYKDGAPLLSTAVVNG
jgi:predicted MPP superfamily phosphohydrolase